MASINKVILIGNLGRDPETRYTADGGTAICNILMATSRRYKDSQGQLQEETEWHRVVFFGRQARLRRPTCAKAIRSTSKVVCVPAATPTKKASNAITLKSSAKRCSCSAAAIPLQLRPIKATRRSSLRAEQPPQLARPLSLPSPLSRLSQPTASATMTFRSNR